MLHGMGIETGVDLDRLIDIGAEISKEIGREGSRVGRAIIAKRSKLNENQITNNQMTTKTSLNTTTTTTNTTNSSNNVDNQPNLCT